MSEQLRAELGRAADGGGPAAADAQLALGRGPIRTRLEASIKALARNRGRDSSTCPSDAARAVGGEDWRALMGDARSLARDLARGGIVEITQRGVVLDPGAEWRGPIRIRICEQ